MNKNLELSMARMIVERPRNEYTVALGFSYDP